MSLGVVLDVAIGLMFTYLLLSLLASGIQELIAGLFELRGKALRDALTSLLEHAPGGSAAVDSLARKVYGHALVQGLGAGKLPSYVPARNVSMAILDTLMDGSQSTLISQCEATVAALPAGRARSTLTTLLVHAGGDLDRFKSLLETWYDDAMDRLSGVYKRQSHYILVGLGMLFAVVMNADSIHIANTLWHDPAMRNALTASARDLVASTPPGTMPAANVPQVLGQIDSQLPIPMGWSGRLPDGAAAWAWAVLGWVMTAFAISLGAPFWFNAMQNVLKLRNAGDRPARADAGSQ